MRVLLCRAWDEAERTALALAAAGHHPVVAPVTRVVVLPVDLPARLPDALLMTSARAASALAQPQVDAVKHLPVYAVGARTAAAARHRGIVDIRVGAGDGAGLAALVALTLPRPARLLYLAGRVRKPFIAEALQASGYRVDILDVYDVESAEPWSGDTLSTLRTGGVAAVLHYSRNSAERAIEAAMAGGVADAFFGLQHLCLSADVAEPLREAGAARIAVAEQPVEASLLALLNTRS